MKSVWVIFHRAGKDMRWEYMRGMVCGKVDGLPLVHACMGRPAVTLPEYIFNTKAGAREAVEKKNE